MNTTWIDEKIFWLTAIFNVDNSLFFSNFNATPEIYSYFESSKTKDIQKVVEIISNKLEFIAPSIEYDWDGNIDDDETRGIIGKGRILISMMNTGDKYALSATTIHELMHYALMYRKNITLLDEEENEKITDLAAIVLGFGKIILNGKVLTSYYIKTTLGVLTPKETAYAYKKICELRHTNNNNYLNDNALNILRGDPIKNDPRFETDYKRYETKKAILTVISIIGIMILSLGEVATETIISIAIIILFFIAIYWLIKVPKKVSPVLKRKKKKCPFCKKDIPNKAYTCPKCKRVLREKFN